jgi:hypothetical protein
MGLHIGFQSPILGAGNLLVTQIISRPWAKLQLQKMRVRMVCWMYGRYKNGAESISIKVGQINY